MRHYEEQNGNADACGFCRERLPDYAAGYLQGGERLSVERHLRTCTRCSAELREWEAIKQAVRVVDGLSLPQRAFADTWSELRAQLPPADIALDRPPNGRVLMEKMTSAGSDESATRPDTSELPRTRLEEPMPKRAHSGKRFRGVAAGAAMVATVAALIAVLITLAPGHRPGTTVGGHETSTNNQNGRWMDLTALNYYPAFDANDVPAIAPTNPSVVYETQAGNYQSHVVATMRRTDDGGKTWHMLPLPVAADHVARLGIAVSPLNTRTVFLKVVEDNAADCPADRAQQNTRGGISNVFCWLQFTSVDGGQHWTVTNLPLANGAQQGVLTASDDPAAETMLSATLHAQGDRLYSGFMCVGWSCTRLVTSADGGLTWQFADEQIMTQPGSICDYAASAHGPTLFALTANNCGEHLRAATQLTLWRSDDASAHWTRVNALSAPSERGMFITADAASGKQLLYMVSPRITSIATDTSGAQFPLYSADATDLKVSADGGRTWESAPSDGIPSNLKAEYDYGTLGTLRDGSVVVEFIAGSAQDPYKGGTLYAWKHGDTAWHQIAPPLKQEIGSMLAIPAKDASQQDTLYLVMVNRGGSDPKTGVNIPSEYSFLRFVP